jgi:Uri superfamily endonuclease
LKGTYVLIINLNKPVQVKVGALGEIAFPAGFYAYVGSAQNNLELRVQRHLRKEKRLFWHVDYLLADCSAKVVAVYCLEGGKECECQTAKLLSQHSEPVPRFGCSDCQCASHLFRADSFEFLKNHLKPLQIKVNNQ